MLDEVTVTSRQISVRHQGVDYIITNIKGSSLADAGSMMDMLSWAPGISVTPDGSLRVFGVSGTPIVYLNGTLLSDNSQIETLPSDMVKSIEVIRKPGSEYPAGTSSVIRITTSIPLSEILNVSLSQRSSVFRRYSNSNSLNLWGSHRNVVAEASLTFMDNNSKQYAEAYENIFDKAGESIRQISTYETDLIHFSRWLWLGGVMWQPDDVDAFQIQYSGQSSRNHRTFGNVRSVTTPDGCTILDYDSDNRSAPVHHSLICSYTHDFADSELNLTATYNNKTSGSEEQVTDNINGILLNIITHDAHSRMWTAKADYNWHRGKGSRQTAGMYAGRSQQYSVADYSATGYQHSEYSVNWGEAYYSLDWDILRCNIRAGIRGRYECQKYHISDADSTARDKRAHFNAVPNVSVFHRFSRRYAMNLYYRYGYSLPSFSELNPAMILTDIIFYEVGNPDLRIPRSHELAIVANLPSLQLVAEYNRYTHRIMSVTTPVDNSEYFLVRPENMGGNYDLKVSASYHCSPLPNMNVYASALVKQSHVEYQYMNEPVKRNQLMAQGMANITYRPATRLSLFMRAIYTSPQLYENIRCGYSCNISLGANLELLKSKLRLRVEVNDLTGKSVTPSWTSYSPNLMRARINRYDTRGITVSATYRFTVAKNDYDELDNADDFDRL